MTSTSSKPATCHPDKRHAGHGLCQTCYRKRLRRDNPDKARAYGRAYYGRHKRQQAGWALMRNYGISLAEYDQMVEDQGNRCLICDDRPEKLHVDHDHETGKVRGLLCWHCNTALGKFKDSPTVLERAINYLTGERLGKLGVEKEDLVAAMAAEAGS